MLPARVDLYDNAYSKYGEDVYCKVRIETYGEDLGQTSWVSREEAGDIPRLLQLQPASNVLEIGCGSGRFGLRLAETVGCEIVGLDVNPHGVENANHLAAAAKLEGRARFQQCDASQVLPFDDASFHAAFANDVLCHVRGRASVFEQVFRVLRPGGRLLFSDALVIGGLISHEEIATRSSIGYYLFSPAGENERLLGGAGFTVLMARDTSAGSAQIAQRWYEARKKFGTELMAMEGEPAFEGLQRFLDCVYRLTSEGRLRRYLYLAEKPASTRVSS